MAPSPELAARAAFRDRFGGEPTVVARSPSRVELLGNHTDHNDGLVLAAAIDRETFVVGRPSADFQARAWSTNFAEADTFEVDAIEPGEPGSWGRYVRGVAWALQGRAPLVSGFSAAISGDVPLGAGLSSSASLQAAVYMFLAGSGAWPHAPEDLMEVAALLRKSENAFVGVQSGLLDQFSVLFGRADHAVTLDCRTLQYDRLPLGDPAPAIVICDSKTSRRLADGMYNIRRAECESVVTHFRERKPASGITHLRDVTLAELLGDWDSLDPAARLRARHVLTENDRVRSGADLLRSGDVAGFGALMSASHASSRDDFANSSPELNALVEAAEAAPGFLGGKLSGAGWAGCTVNLVSADRVDAFVESVSSGYSRRTGLTLSAYACRAADGASARVELG